jgi:di/tricarboxylate transporter
MTEMEQQRAKLTIIIVCFAFVLFIALFLVSQALAFAIWDWVVPAAHPAFLNLSLGFLMVPFLVVMGIAICGYEEEDSTTRRRKTKNRKGSAIGFD